MGAVSRPRSLNASEFCSKLSATIAATAVSKTVSAAVQKQDSDYDEPDNVVIVEKIAKTVHGVNLHLILGGALALSNIILCRTRADVKDFLIFLSKMGKNKISDMYVVLLRTV